MERGRRFFCFTTIRNYITLKRKGKGLEPLPCFTTIRNYITLKHE